MCALCPELRVLECFAPEPSGGDAATSADGSNLSSRGAIRRLLAPIAALLRADCVAALIGVSDSALVEWAYLWSACFVCAPEST